MRIIFLFINQKGLRLFGVDSWMENKLYMDGMSLADVCKYLERWYNVNIILPKEVGDNIYFTGAIQEESITDVMNALARLSDLEYSIKGKNICITSK